jgi:hypothetical protein
VITDTKRMNKSGEAVGREEPSCTDAVVRGIGEEVVVVVVKSVSLTVRSRTNEAI